MPDKLVIISSNSSWNIYNFRAMLVQCLKQRGYEVVVAAPIDDYTLPMTYLGCRHITLPIDSKGVSIFRDAILFFRYLRLLWYMSPSVFLGYTIKPNIYGSIAAHLLGIPVINNVSGLGTAFLRETWLTKLVKLLYWVALRSSRKVFFQNQEDRDLFIGSRIVRPERAFLLPGSGVDLQKFSPQVPAAKTTPTAPKTFLLVARLIWDKGVGEYVKAARTVRRRFPDARFQNPRLSRRGEPECNLAVPDGRMGKGRNSGVSWDSG